MGKTRHYHTEGTLSLHSNRALNIFAVRYYGGGFTFGIYDYRLPLVTIW